MGVGRRDFLCNGLISLSAVAFSSSVIAEPEQPAYFVVTAGKCRIDGPWTVHGEPSFFNKISGVDVDRRMSVIEVKTPPGQGPPMHINLEHNEWMYLLEGSFGLQCGTEETVLQTGDSFMAPKEYLTPMSCSGIRPLDI